MMLKDFTASLLIIIFIIILSIGGFYGYEEYRLYDAVQKLNEKDATVYLDTSKCGYCVKQVQFLRNHITKLNTVHCDDEANKDKCKSVKAYPTWELNNKKFPGSRFSIESLYSLANEA